MYKDTGLKPREVVSDVFPNWTQPSRVGYFCVDSERFYKKGHDNLRFFRMPEKSEFPLDLNAGIESAKKKLKNPMEEGIEHLLKFIVDNYSQLKKTLDKNIGGQTHQRTHKPLFPVEFVSYRGLLRLIMCTPTELQNDWIINVTHYKGTFYFCQEETEYSKQQRLKETDIQKKMSAWGFKFEQYCLSDAPNTKPDTNIPVDECSEFSCVFNTKIQGINLLYGAEMDCVRSNTMLPNDDGPPLEDWEFLELKSCLGDMHNRQLQNHRRFRTRNWWCQSFLVGIQNIIVGWRDQNGFIKEIQQIPVSHFAKEAKKFQNWSASQCSWFLISFLNCVKTLMATVDSPNTVWEFRYNARNGSISYKVFENDIEKIFLPEYYVDFIENLSRR